MQPSKTIFFNDHDASADSVSNHRSQCLNYGWTLMVSKTGTDGDGQILLEQSQDGSTWFPYIDREICTDLILESVITLNDDEFLITDEYFHGNFFRVSYIANGTTTGTIDVVLSEKIRS